MDFGLYEKLLDSELKNQISELHNETRKVDSSESASVLATAYYKIWRKILSEKKNEEDLRLEREEYGSYKNLVVAATGTGKTMVAAFDYQEQIKRGDKKLLFLAHRKEILDQSLYTFRNVLKDQNFGELWVGGNTPIDHTHIFASVQTLNSNENYKRFARDYFD